MLVAEFGLHSSNCLNRHTDDAFFLPGKVQLAIIPPVPVGLCGGFRLDLHCAVIVVCRLGNVTCDHGAPHESLIR